MILWRRGWIAALTLLSAMLVAGGVLLFVPGRYDAVATASIDPGHLDPITEMGSSSSAAIGLMQGNMIQLVTSQRVARDVVERLNLTANPQVQAQFRASDSFGRESIENWYAAGLLKNVDAKFAFGTDVLSIKYKSGDPNQSALIANAFLAATIDASIAMKASSAEQTASWFTPQLDNLRKEFQKSRAALEDYQVRTNVVAPTGAEDTQTNELMAITRNLSSTKANLSMLQSRLSSGATDLSIDPSDPDLQVLAALKDKLSSMETSVASIKGSVGPNNPKMVAGAANIAAIRNQIAETTEKMRRHLKERIAETQGLIASLQAEQAEAQKSLIAAQAQRNQLVELQRDVAFRLNQLNALEKMAEQAKLQSKLTFAGIAVLDKAVPPIAPAFPKPLLVILVGFGAGLTLGLILALIAEMTDRRVRYPIDLELAASGPVLGSIGSNRRSTLRIGGSGRGLRAA